MEGLFEAELGHSCDQVVVGDSPLPDVVDVAPVAIVRRVLFVELAEEVGIGRVVAVVRDVAEVRILSKIEQPDRLLAGVLLVEDHHV
ncbi:hypothetical protein [Thauera sp.]